MLDESNLINSCINRLRLFLSDDCVVKSNSAYYYFIYCFNKIIDGAEL